MGPSALASARRIQQALPGAVLHLLRKRFTSTHAPDIDGAAVYIDALGPHLRRCYTEGTPLIALCAAGIVIRCLAPVIGASAKTDEPAVLAVAEDGSAVVPLLGGLRGANDLARRVADVFACEPAITTSGELRFGRCLLSPPDGYALADIDAGKRFVSDLLAGAPVQVDGAAPWLDDLGLPKTGEIAEATAPFDPASPPRRTIRIGIERTAPDDTLLIHPRSVIVNVRRVDDTLAERIDTLLREADIARAALAVLCCSLSLMGDDRIDEAADELGVPVRYIETAPMPHTDEGGGLSLDVQASPVTVAEIGIARGTLSVIGLGPGDKSMLAPAAAEALRQASDILGYTTYVEMAGPFAAWQRVHGTDNREEMARARHALRLAAAGHRVAIVSSGDPGVFAMAAAVMEALDIDDAGRRPASADRRADPPLSQAELSRVRVQIIPGITAAFATAAAAGAPLGHDCCLISLSDNLKPWDIIETRLQLAAQADMAIAFYNPISRARPWQLDRALDVLRTIRRPETPVVLGRDIGRPGGRIRHHTLGSVQASDVDMRTMVIIGASTTRRITLGSAPGTSNDPADMQTQTQADGACRQMVYTPRWYPAAGQDQ
ncbi:bifunctional cobalt-precorrin 5A hydrolase/precorrin-3B C(17)-methyltransferase [Robbsia sp. KACC 23696]|uniref:bifunctional cobalt-precorrin 5A hydrolase/precorrin-3B C(17)-methyltransferase n=1 Tax=Robbsia sp. KACC 23696 TaxID=3149231 RepID=UPI00325AD362